MRVIAKRTLRAYWEIHEDARGPLEAWYEFVRRATWSSTIDVKRDYGSASFLANNRVVFNIKGGQYRLVVKIDYAAQTVLIRFIGTHQEYDRV